MLRILVLAAALLVLTGCFAVSTCRKLPNPAHTCFTQNHKRPLESAAS